MHIKRQFHSVGGSSTQQWLTNQTASQRSSRDETEIVEELKDTMTFDEDGNEVNMYNLLSEATADTWTQWIELNDSTSDTFFVTDDKDQVYELTREQAMAIWNLLSGGQPTQESRHLISQTPLRRSKNTRLGSAAPHYATKGRLLGASVMHAVSQQSFM
jgi:hypothetical protein